MIEMKTVDLTGPALDWAIAQIEGVEVAIAAPHYGTGWRVYKPNFGGKYSPSTEWAFGGPLIAKHAIGFVGHDADNWLAFSSPADSTHQGIGPTHLIAACRAIVAAKLGDTLQVPRELLT